MATSSPPALALDNNIMQHMHLRPLSSAEVGIGVRIIAKWQFVHAVGVERVPQPLVARLPPALIAHCALVGQEELRACKALDAWLQREHAAVEHAARALTRRPIRRCRVLGAREAIVEVEVSGEGRRSTR